MDPNVGVTTGCSDYINVSGQSPVFFFQSSDKMAPAQTLPDVRAPSTPVLKQGVQEDYEGNYRFAPIEEAQVARAMIKRLVSIWLVSPQRTLTARGKKSGTTTACMNVSSRTLSSSALVALACLAPITSQRLVRTWVSWQFRSRLLSHVNKTSLKSP